MDKKPTAISVLFLSPESLLSINDLNENGWVPEAEAILTSEKFNSKIRPGNNPNPLTKNRSVLISPLLIPKNKAIPRERNTRESPVTREILPLCRFSLIFCFGRRTSWSARNLFRLEKNIPAKITEITRVPAIMERGRMCTEAIEVRTISFQIVFIASNIRLLYPILNGIPRIIPITTRVMASKNSSFLIVLKENPMALNVRLSDFL